MQKIITIPNPILRQTSKPINPTDKRTTRTIKEIEEVLTGGERAKGVGLSAVQIGRLHRIFSLYLSATGDPNDEKNLKLTTFINPEILKVSKKKTLGPNRKRPVLEGCLSIPNIWGPIYRHQWIVLKWETPNGKTEQQKFTNFPARVIQHENDHLNGVLFTDHSLANQLPLYESNGEKLVELELPQLS